MNSKIIINKYLIWFFLFIALSLCGIINTPITDWWSTFYRIMVIWVVCFAYTCFIVDKKDFYTVIYAFVFGASVTIETNEDKSASVLSILFSSRQIEKYYVAVSDKKPKKKQGIICGDMKKARRGQWKLCRTYENPAITRFSSLKYEDKYLFLLKPQTGKTHQIRVAMKSICAPIIGDVLYGGTVSDRGYLHSIKLSFSYKGKKYEYISYPNVGKFFIDEQLESLMSEIML
jgi:tRNA pseudouridine32 synthase/23S rRNA pseudouridine746 synthase